MEPTLWLGDCLEKMKEISDGAVDMVLCDLPYEVTARQKWDVVIPFAPLWEAYQRVAKPSAAICLTATEPFRTRLISSNFDLFKYDLIWQKNKATGFLNAKKQPLRSHESILIFYNKPPTYNPQKTAGKPRKAGFTRREETNTMIYGDVKASGYTYTEERYPTSVLPFDIVNNDSPEKTHSAQKPVALMEWLIKTYTNEGETVLDNCMGSATTGVACINLNRRFIGIERDEDYFRIGSERVRVAMAAKGQS